MQTTIPKRASSIHAYERPVYAFQNARAALFAILKALKLCESEQILLPSYIGWSKNEGSGVYDPIASLNLQPVFYRLTRDLAIDLIDLETKMRSSTARVLLVIHYFGFPDPQMPDVAKLAEKHDLTVIEDEAHALFSDWVGGICGRTGLASVMSLHKMLPADSGGLLILNKPGSKVWQDISETSHAQTMLAYNPINYDYFTIASVRLANAEYLLKALEHLRGRIEPLHPSIKQGVVPQTLPVLVHSVDRNELYQIMNNAGFGVVSLYHTLISIIDEKQFPESHWVAKRILNLPVHQEATLDALAAMIDLLDRVA
jgi:dTDP-4-amino-4,6-dideoxygalactose transaminase